MDPTQNTNQPQVPNVPPVSPPVQSQPVAPPSTPNVKSSRGIFIALILVLLVVAGGMLYFVFGMPETEKQEVTQLQTQPTVGPTPTPQAEEEQLEEVIIASPDADLSDLEKDLDSL